MNVCKLEKKLSGGIKVIKVRRTSVNSTQAVILRGVFFVLFLYYKSLIRPRVGINAKTKCKQWCKEFDFVETPFL